MRKMNSNADVLSRVVPAQINNIRDATALEDFIQFLYKTLSAPKTDKIPCDNAYFQNVYFYCRDFDGNTIKVPTLHQNFWRT